MWKLVIEKSLSNPLVKGAKSTGRKHGLCQSAYRNISVDDIFSVIECFDDFCVGLCIVYALVLFAFSSARFFSHALT